MTRKSRNLQPKKAIYVFWEGESEEAYTRFLKEHFSASATIKIHREKGTFDKARACYRGDVRFHNDIDELDELWFFFDTEVEKGNQYAAAFDCLKGILKARRKNPLTIRLLMTTGCIEYWLLLHYERVAPGIVTAEDKEAILKRLQGHVNNYRKGDYSSVLTIGDLLKTALKNGEWTLLRLQAEGMPDYTPEDTKERDKWLFKGVHTFTTVHEAILMLEKLPRLG